MSPRISQPTETIVGVARMVRFLAILALFAVLALAQGGEGSFAATGPAANGPTLTTVHLGTGAGGHGGENLGMAAHGCHHLSCSPSLLGKPRFVPDYGTARSADKAANNESNPRSAIIDRDPPVPRALT